MEKPKRPPFVVVLAFARTTPGGIEPAGNDGAKAPTGA